MSAELHIGLAWLPPPPADFAAICRSIAADEAPGAAIRALANHALDSNQLHRLGGVITRAIAEGRLSIHCSRCALGLSATARSTFLRQRWSQAPRGMASRFHAFRPNTGR